MGINIRQEDENWLMNVSERWHFKNQEELNYELIMLPINISGYITGKDTPKILQWIEKTKKTVIAMKTLVESNTTIKQALKHAIKQKNVKAIAVGITSKKEAKETLTTLKTLFKEKQNSEKLL